jgi:S1-C subfamily serine protease
MPLSFGLRLAAVSTVLVALLAPARAAADPQVVGGRYKFTPWKLGVDGFNTGDGFVITRVFHGYAANNLRLNGRPYTLEPGDRVVEVDGVPVNRSWTLQRALGFTAGRVDLKVWDDRAGDYLYFNGVRLSR